MLFSGGSDDDRGDDEDDSKEEQQGMPSVSIDEKKDPSALSRASSAIFIFTSYCFQFIGAFFGFGLILNVLGYGYTIDLNRDQPLVIEKMSDLRNDIQFEREIEREMREDSVKMKSNYLLAPTVSEVGDTNNGASD